MNSQDSPDPTAQAAYSRVVWHSRRGMLELDIVLERFVKQRYPQLSEQDQQVYRRLLDCEDQQLFDWFLKKKPVDDKELAVMVGQILDYQRNSGE